MKSTLCPKLVAALLLLASVTTGNCADLRQTLNFNRDWKFALGDTAGAEKTSFNDSKWEPVGIPHSFSIPYFGDTKFYTGYGWYRKHFTAPQYWQGNRVSLDFEGVFQEAEVFVNGKSVGRHRGGYTGFYVDISEAIFPGADNVVSVRVNNLWNPRLAPRAGEHTFSGGIYRDVHLVVTNPLHVAWYGTAVTTPQVSKEAATVNVKTEVVNESAAPKGTLVTQAVLDSEGHTVVQFSSSVNVPAHQAVVVDQTSDPIQNPKLWSPTAPNLYTVKTTLSNGNTPVDDFTSPLGIRSLKWTTDQGIFLNGEHLYFVGANVHQDHAGWGDAVTDGGFARDVKMVKDAGFNFIRGSHYPHDPAFVSACDSLGICYWSENAFWGIGGYKPDGYWNSSAYPPKPEDQPEFEASVIQELGEMIRVHRNHPSIVAWSMCNEVFFTEPSAQPKMRAFLKKLVEQTHKLDPTRPAAIGGCQRPLDQNRIDTIGDVAGYNGDGASLPVFQNPGVANLVSEYGSVTAVRPGDYKPGWDNLAKDNGAPVHPWRSGQSIWCMFDHGSIAGINLGRMGLVDYFRIPKRGWYWYREHYRHIPPPEWPSQGTPSQLLLEADKLKVASSDGSDDVQLLVSVTDAAGKPLNNVVPVTLEIVSGPGEFPTGRSITFDPNSDIAILDGKAAIEMRSYYAGKSVVRASSPGLKTSELSIEWKGDFAWVENASPMVKTRPYVRFSDREKDAEGLSLDVNLAADRPTRCSSADAKFSSANVTDRSPSTVWKAASKDSFPWIGVDLENTYTLKKVGLTFADAAPRRYQVEVSVDGTHWTSVVDKSQADQTDKQPTFTGDFGKGLRFIRVKFTKWPIGQPASLAEIEVGGGTE